MPLVQIFWFPSWIICAVICDLQNNFTLKYHFHRTIKSGRGFRASPVPPPARSRVSYEKVTRALRALSRQQHRRKNFSYAYSAGLITEEHHKLPGASIYTRTSTNPNSSGTKQKADILNYMFNSIKKYRKYLEGGEERAKRTGRSVLSALITQIEMSKHLPQFYNILQHRGLL